MKMSFRWYGETDPISLEYIRQIPNMRSIVSAVYDVKPGEVWPEESLAKMKKDGATVSSDVLVKICTALNCTMDEIVEIVQGKEPKELFRQKDEL